MKKNDYMTFASDHVLQLLNVETFPTDIDEKFIDNFIELYLPVGRKSLQKIETFCFHSQISEVILALYMQLLRKTAKNEGATIFELSSNFLYQNESALLAGSPTLQQSFFGFITDMELVEVKHLFRFDLSAKIYEVLSCDATSLYVRLCVENLAIVHINNLLKRDSSANFLLWSLAESLIETDYILAMDSISKVLSKFINNLSKSFCERLIQKAKNSRRIGLVFARLIAEIFASDYFGNFKIIANGFSDQYSHALILSQLVEYNRNLLKYSELELFNLLVVTAGNRVNFIIPYLARSNVFLDCKSKQEIFNFLKPMIPNLSKPKLCSNENIGIFLHFLSKFDHANMEVFPSVIDVLEKRIISTPNLLKYLLELQRPTFVEILNRTCLRKILSNSISKYFNASSADMENIDEGWEDRDSMLELLQICDARLLGFDLIQLTRCVFKILITDQNYFVKGSARDCLLKIYDNYALEFDFSFLSSEQLTQIKIMKAKAVEEEDQRRKSKTIYKDIRQNIRTEIDDIISLMRHNCGVDDCVSKECY